eukprot:s2004_g11.t1
MTRAWSLNECWRLRKFAKRCSWTPLHLVASTGDEKCMQVLLQAGAAKDATTCDGRTPLHVAASRGDMAILEGRKTEALLVLRLLLLYYSCFYHALRLQLLVLVLLPLSGTAWALLVRPEVAGRWRCEGWTPLHCAAQYADLACLDALLRAGAIKDVQDNCGWTPLHWAAHCGNVECLVALLNAGAATDMRENSGSTPLHWAASHGQTECLATLLNAGAAEARRRSKSPQSLAT